MFTGAYQFGVKNAVTPGTVEDRHAISCSERSFQIKGGTARES